MKYITIIITAIILTINILAGLVLSDYKQFNVAFTSVIIVITGLLVYIIQSIQIKKAFAISLAFFFSFMGFIAYILGLLSPEGLKDNGYAVVSLAIIAIEIIVLLICSITSKKVK